MNHKLFHEQFREDRTRLGITLSDVAQNAGVSVGFLCDFEHGRRIISRESLAKKIIESVYKRRFERQHMVYLSFMEFSINNQNKWCER